MLKARDNDVLYRFKSNLFPIMSDTTLYATSRETPVDEDSFIDEIRNDEKNINSEIFDEYFRYQIHHF